MAAMDKYLILFSLVLFVGQVIGGTKFPIKVQVIDDIDVESIARLVCTIKESDEWQIGRVSTIINLSGFMESISEAHELSECRNRYLGSFQHLYELVSVGNEDVCSSKKIDQLIDFHQKYVSKTDVDKELQLKEGYEAPRLLVLFYLHYAYQVSVTCKKSLIEQLDSAEAKASELELVGKTSELKELDHINKEFAAMLGAPSGSLKKLHDIILPWSLFDKAYTGLGIQSDYFVEPTAENNYTRASFTGYEIEKIRRCQRECKSFQSTYENPLLAVVRLIDLGYYLDDEPFAKELNDRPNMRRLIGLTVICETLMPIRFIQNDQVQPGKMILINNELSKKLIHPKPSDDDVKPVYGYNEKNLERNSWVMDHDRLSSVTSSYAEPLVEKLRDNIRRREHFIKRVFKGLFVMLKMKIKSFFQKIFCMSKNQDKDIFPVDALSLFKMLA